MMIAEIERKVRSMIAIVVHVGTESGTGAETDIKIEIETNIEIETTLEI